MSITITIIIVVVTCIVSFTAFSNEKLTDQLIFTPPAVTYHHQWYRFFSCALIHADIAHLAFNMFSFYSFGNFIEGYFSAIFGSLGPVLFLALYIISQFLCLIPTYLKNKDNYYYRSLGASGAVSAVIFAGIFLSPLSEVGIPFIPIHFPGFIFGFIYLGITYYLDRKGGSRVNHSAHLFGALAGIMLIIVFGFLFSSENLIENFLGQVRSYHL